MKFTYDYLWRQLAKIYDAGEAKSIVKLVLERRFGLSSADVYCGKTESLSEQDAAELGEMMARLENHEPVQYVLGTAEFCGRDFIVGEGVLIPRPETAELVNLMIEDVDMEYQSDKNVTILDVGTGSGCIAVSLSLAIQHSQVFAWDLSDAAIEICSENARKFSADIDISKVDALHPPHDIRRWDIIVSNPPYICDREKNDIDRNVLDFEPGMALFVPDENPLMFYRAIAIYAKEALKGNGKLYFEINPIYSTELTDMLSDMAFAEVKLVKDEFGKQRFVKCKL
jgi:release factor glutamine methyltransferase